MAQRFKSFFLCFLVATAAALCVRCFVLEDYRIASKSMEPTLLVGDLVLVSKLSFNFRLPFSSYELFSFRRPQRGDIVAFTKQDKGSEVFIKRVVAIEGEKFALRQGKLFINDTVWNFSSNTSNDGVEDFGPIEIPPSHFFVLGDNQKESVDSRTWGPLPYSSLKGRVGAIWMSLNPDGGTRYARIGWIRR